MLLIHVTAMVNLTTNAKPIGVTRSHTPRYSSAGIGPPNTLSPYSEQSQLWPEVPRVITPGIHSEDRLAKNLPQPTSYPSLFRPRIKHHLSENDLSFYSDSFLFSVSLYLIEYFLINYFLISQIIGRNDYLSHP